MNLRNTIFAAGIFTLGAGCGEDPCFKAVDYQDVDAVVSFCKSKPDGRIRLDETIPIGIVNSVKTCNEIVGEKSEEIRRLLANKSAYLSCPEK